MAKTFKKGKSSNEKKEKNRLNKKTEGVKVNYTKKDKNNIDRNDKKGGKKVNKKGSKIDKKKNEGGKKTLVENKKQKSDKNKEDWDDKCKEILNDENLSKSKKKKLIKEYKKKKFAENYDYYKKLKLNLNDLLRSKDKSEKNKQINIIYNELKKIELSKFCRTNLGYHIISALIINSDEECQNKLWKTISTNMNDICVFNFVSLTFQCFYKHAKNDQIRNDICMWLIKNPKNFLTKFASRLWHIVFKKLKTDMKIKIINSLILPNINSLKNVSFELLKKPTKEMFVTLSEENKTAICNYLIEYIENVVEKELLYNIVTHNLILTATEILAEGEENIVNDKLTKLMEIIHEGCEYLISTNIGNKALIYLLGYSTSKHKKTLIKILKNYMVDLCKNSVNFLLVIRLLKITDDTKLLNDYIVKKITNSFEEIFNDYYGFYVILEFFYDINQYNEDKYFFVDWKNMIYSKTVKSVKDGCKRKNEIIQPIIEQLKNIFNEKDKLNSYLNDKKYVIIIFEYIQFTQDDQIINNILSILGDIILLLKNDENINEKYNCKNINELFLKLYTCTKNQDIFKKVTNQNNPSSMFYQLLSDLFITNIEIILKSELIKTFNNFIIFIKDTDNNIYQQILSKAKNTNNDAIYNTLKEILPNMTYFNKYLELINQ
ncbi:conserved Plasmodium protein, unknown function [Plasmodium berghei]|uniref:mRNA-binding protein PUF3, putative n=2 Tax=Plasmodium berghei TaxID=5821 RepID=A0A509AME0_PLABA|nr:mRNA-binding protein PUF3, putative [Plasmodium berghei ANKA]CXI63805.1 conserved Plasmodium protein, unknown function [Plasmodium berghei]SCM23824.1 conserved Plasmodium protein, unknown function [Plasmodium berghei]SCN26793.1 conserved Plasmodium protein, unknown function [Plasmodium berghei]SCO61140.1 conserved Plasmodium protein, unknown function [Plasmodium berghei]SCO63212.1 conserved Plasmodium protein, unknown function [Plasmodium berghei]|eukprot:XP_034422410.1 mRNA-binding protein PUF3, putative [Plasmodium berghei ANKA]